MLRGPPRPGASVRRPRRSGIGARAAPTVKRGRIGLRVCGRNEQRSAISTVEASASGRSANSTAISARVLKRCSGVSCSRSVSAISWPPAMHSSASCGLVVVGAGEIRLVGRDQRQALARRRDRSARPRRGAPCRCRGAAIRHRGGRRTGWPGVRSGCAASAACSAAQRQRDRPVRPAGQRDQALGRRRSSQSSLMCGVSVRPASPGTPASSAASGCW